MMQNTENTVVDGSSSILVDFIDLTESPTIGTTKPHRKHTKNACTGMAEGNRGGNSHCYMLARRCLSETPRKKPKYKNIRCTNEIMDLDDTIIVEEDNEHYATKSDNEKPRLLTCPICFEFLSSNLKPTTTRCGHLFCVQCVEKVLCTSKKCPTCKSSITLKSCIRVFL